MANFQRVYHPHELWEEISHGMWDSVADHAAMLILAINLTSDYERYGSFMRRVVAEWPMSCENALTDSYLNKRAWIGHAAAALAIQCPEDITRKAWGHLTHGQQSLANREADRAIRMWERSYRKD